MVALREFFLLWCTLARGQGSSVSLFRRDHGRKKTMTQSPSAFRLSVWKPANLTRRFMVCSSDQTNIECELHEQMYSWEPDEDVWGGLKDREQTRRARAALVEAFDPSKPVSDRSISHLEEALRILADVLGTAGATGWSDCNETVGLRSDDQINLRANTVLMLSRHLEWVLNVFRHVPGASVTVR